MSDTPEHQTDYKARIDIARGIASLVPTSDAGETLIALADAVEALVAENEKLRANPQDAFDAQCDQQGIHRYKDLVARSAVISSSSSVSSSSMARC